MIPKRGHGFSDKIILQHYLNAGMTSRVNNSVERDAASNGMLPNAMSAPK
jgi:hypothetical protein